MFRVRLLMGLTMAAMMDVGFGILIAWSLSKFFHRPVSLWVYGAGISFALWADCDLIIEKLFSNNLLFLRHRAITHYPLLIIPIFLIISIFSLFWAALFSFCWLVHLCHDSVGEANLGGVKWLAPFSRKRFQIMGTKLGRRQFFCGWTVEEWEKEMTAYPLSFFGCLEKYFLNLTAHSAGAILVFGAAIFIMLVG